MSITRREIAEGLRALGLSEGDRVILHSSLSSLGTVAGGADAVVDAFLDVLGASGTLLVPTFGALGVIPDAVKARPDAVHSIHPLASVAAIGAEAESFCRDHWKAELAHTEDTPYLRLAEAGGWVCLLGVDQDRNTMLHTAEELLRLPYLKETDAKTFDTPEGEVTRSWPFFPGPHRDFIGLDRLFRSRGIMRMGRIGGSVVRLIPAKELVEIATAAGRADPAFVLCDNPACRDCVRQRAELRRVRFAKESFALTASAALAGRYPEEIADACALAGIDRVELDFLKGLPLTRLEPEAIRRAVSTFDEAGLTVSALRAATVPDDPESLLQTAREAGIGRVVIPLSGEAARHARVSQEAGVAVRFVNTHLGSRDASRILQELNAAGLGSDFCFHAANFARAGENPFLGSYKQKLRRHVESLEISDALYAGPARPLARGNAEIKEMVSILRAASFRGEMILGADNTACGTLEEAARAFEHLLDTM